MKLKLLQLLVFIFIAFSFGANAQEVSKERTTKYIFDLNAIKHQSQVDGVSNQTKTIKGVQSCNLNWLEYKMEVIVKEGGQYGNFSMEKLKAILLDNRVQLKKVTKTTVN